MRGIDKASIDSRFCALYRVILPEETSRSKKSSQKANCGNLFFKATVAV